MIDQSVGIYGTGSFVPEKIITNKDLEKMVDTSDEWIQSRTGIRERRICSDDMASSDMAYEASLKAIERSGLTVDDLDLIIVATVTPDTSFPSTACILQDRLGAKQIPAFDISAACSGFLYGVSTGSQFIKTGQYRHVLVVGVESLSKITNWKDRNTSILFGDGAGAVILGPVEEGYGFLSFELGADGSGGKLLTVPGGGSRMPVSHTSIEQEKHFIHMSGNEVFKFAVRVMEQVSESVIQKAGLTKEDVQFLVPHQANKRIIDAARKRLHLTEDKVVINLDRYGNMSSASIPVALDEAVQQKRINKGDVIVFVGFGGGLTWAGSAMRWNMTQKEDQ